MTKKVILYTDGACSGNPGPGGWGCVLIYAESFRKLSGYDPYTTNNRMELMAVIKGLSCLLKPVELTIITDSKYVKNAFSENWLANWQRNNWQTSAKTAVKNKDLWLDLLALSKAHQITWTWVKGHAGNEYNEMCDLLARTAIQQQVGIDSRCNT